MSQPISTPTPSCAPLPPPYLQHQHGVWGANML